MKANIYNYEKSLKALGHNIPKRHYWTKTEVEELMSDYYCIRKSFGCIPSAWFKKMAEKYNCKPTAIERRIRAQMYERN